MWDFAKSQTFRRYYFLNDVSVKPDQYAKRQVLCLEVGFFTGLDSYGAQVHFTNIKCDGDLDPTYFFHLKRDPSPRLILRSIYLQFAFGWLVGWLVGCESSFDLVRSRAS